MTITASRSVDIPVTITCPSWCIVDPQEHAAELWNQGGDCLHRSADYIVEDPSQGPQVHALDKPRPADSILIYLVATTGPSGQESATPWFNIEPGQGSSIEQVEALVETLTEMVATYRAAGGVG